MKTRVIVIIISLVLIFLLSGCTEDSGENVGQFQKVGGDANFTEICVVTDYWADVEILNPQSQTAYSYRWFREFTCNSSIDPYRWFDMSGDRLDSGSEPFNIGALVKLYWFLEENHAPRFNGFTRVDND